MTNHEKQIKSKILEFIRDCLGESELNDIKTVDAQFNQMQIMMEDGKWYTITIQSDQE